MVKAIINKMIYSLLSQSEKISRSFRNYYL